MKLIYSTINKDYLKQILIQVQPALLKDTSFFQENNFIFNDNYVICYNDETIALCPIDIPWNGAIKADELYNFIRLIKQKEILIAETDDGVYIKTNKSLTEIKKQNYKNDTYKEIKIPDEWLNLSDDFCDAFSFCANYSCGYSSSALLQYVYIENDKMFATNNEHFIKYNLKQGYPRLFINNKTAKHLQNHKSIQYAVTDDWLFFKNADGIVLGTKLLHSDEEFPMLDEDMFNQSGIDLELNDIQEDIKMCELFSKSSANDLTCIKLKGDSKLIKAYGTGDFGRHVSVLGKTNNEFEFYIEPFVLLKCLKDNALFTYCDSFLRIDSEEYSLLICLINME